MPTGNPGEKRPGISGQEFQRLNYFGQRFEACSGCGWNISGDPYRPASLCRLYLFHDERCYDRWHDAGGYVTHSNPCWKDPNSEYAPE